MQFDLGNINYLAVVVGFVMNMAAGALWYSPLLFARPWMALNNLTEEAIRESVSATPGYIVSIIASVIIVLAIAVVAELAGADALIDGLLIGLIAGVGFVATTAASSYTFESRGIKHYLINTGYPISTFVIIGAVIGVWQ